VLGNSPTDFLVVVKGKRKRSETVIKDNGRSALGVFLATRALPKAFRSLSHLNIYFLFFTRKDCIEYYMISSDWNSIHKRCVCYYVYKQSEF